jgi:glycerol-3-phosphate dehydrogenase
MADLFDTSFVSVFISTDPIGVQTADILARIYALWINYAESAGIIENSTQVGYLMAQVADEASSLALHLGGSPKTFEAGSIPWTAAFTSLYLGGLWKDFGQKVGTGVKKGKSPDHMLSKIRKQYESSGIRLQSLLDITAAHACAARYNLNLPVLEEVVKTFQDPAP